VTEPTPADLAAQIASLPAAERAIVQALIVQALIDRFLLLAGPRPKRRRPPAGYVPTASPALL
jgi:hypothetical protein